MPLQATSGAASYDGFGGGAAAAPTYIEEVFSAFLWTGTGGQAGPFVTGIDLLNKGGLLWTKSRSNAYDNYLMDTVRGNGSILTTNNAAAAVSSPACVNFYADGFKDNFSYGGGTTQVSWTFREQPKFFDVVTYTGTGSNRTVAHALGSVPASIWVKRTDTTSDWQVYHRSLANTEYLVLNSTAAKATGATRWNSTTPTSSVFSLGTDASVNASAGTYVAYIFAHDAGGFGLTGTDNVISCGSYTGIAYPNSLEVTIGFEPQFVIIKNSNTASDWTMWDIMRGMAVIPAANDAQAQILNPNTSAAESIQPGIFPTATGFVVKNGLTAISSPSDKMIYIAIRRGPMKVPTDATKVYNGVNNNSGLINVGFVPDLALINTKAQWDRNPAMARLTGTGSLRTNATNAEETQTIYWDKTTGYFEQATTGGTPMSWFFRRAPSFFDEVCYTGNQTSTPKTHNLGVAPELMIVKSRSAANDWAVYSSALGATKYLRLNNTSAEGTSVVYWNDTAPTSTGFTCSIYADYTNTTGQNYVAYLFATCAGVSKVGSYTGNGSSQTINCGFTGGARFVMVKATSTTGNWIVADSARGIVAGNDPALYLNSTAAEVTGLDWIDADNSGFVVNETATIAANTNGVSYIFFAVA